MAVEKKLESLNAFLMKNWRSLVSWTWNVNGIQI